MPRVPLRPFWTTTDGETVKLFRGDVIDVLRRMPAESVQCVTTSPPYWGLRSYLDNGHTDKGIEIGSEKTPAEYVEKMVAVFREIRRVLRDDGTAWLNIGGGYLPGGQMDGVPFRLVLALQDDGWIWRQDIIWNKPSPMPESCKNRCTKAHEYVFLLTKSQRYFYDAEAIKDKATQGMVDRVNHELEAARERKLYKQNQAVQRDDPSVSPNSAWHDPKKLNRLLGGSNKRSVWTVDDHRSLLDWLAEKDPWLLERFLEQSRNKGDVWRCSSQGYAGAHFATYPPKLIKPMILAGTSEYGACAECGAPWKRVVTEEKLIRSRPNDYVKRTGEEGTGNSCPNSAAGVETKTVGWEPTCECDCSSVVPCVVLDPFCGSGTSNVVSLALGRRSIGIDLSADYLTNNAIPRIVGALLSRPSLAGLVPREAVEAFADGEEI